MNRLVYAVVLVLVAGGVWTAVENFRIKHPVSGSRSRSPGKTARTRCS